MSWKRGFQTTCQDCFGCRELVTMNALQKASARKKQAENSASNDCKWTPYHLHHQSPFGGLTSPKFLHLSTGDWSQSQLLWRVFPTKFMRAMVPKRNMKQRLHSRSVAPCLGYSPPARNPLKIQKMKSWSKWPAWYYTRPGLPQSRQSEDSVKYHDSDDLKLIFWKGDQCKGPTWLTLEFIGLEQRSNLKK